MNQEEIENTIRILMLDRGFVWNEETRKWEETNKNLSYVQKGNWQVLVY